MANKDLLKQAIAEAKSVREAAIANAKEALEESLTPHLKDMLAAKLQEMEGSQEDEVVNESVEELEEMDHNEEEMEEQVAENDELAEVEDDAEEAEDDSEESEDEAEDEDSAEDDQEVGELSVDEFKDMIRDIISQEIDDAISGEDELEVDDMDAGDIEGLGDEAPMEEPPAEEEEIDLDELLAELEGMDETYHEEEMEEELNEEEEVEESNKMEEELNEALKTIETLQKDLQEVNLLNSKLLYVNKIFKANNLNESQKVNIIAAFDKAETVKETKLVYETVSENFTQQSKAVNSKTKIAEGKLGMASKATGTTAAKPEIISEVSSAVERMQVLAGIKNPIMEIANGNLIVDKDVEFLKLLTSFRP